MDKRSALLSQCTTRTDNARAIETELVQGVQVNNGGALHASRGRDGSRHTAEESDEVRVVNVQVNGRAAGLSNVANGRRPIRSRDDPNETAAEQWAKPSTARYL